MSSSYIVGLFFILIGSILWNATAIIVQYLYIQYDFDSPFLVTYVGCCLFILLIPSSLMNEVKIFEQGQEYTDIKVASDIEEQQEESTIEDESSALMNNTSQTGGTFPVQSNDDHGENDTIKKVTNKYMKAALKVLPLWFSANYFYNFSLVATSITSTTIMSNMGCVFTFLFAVMSGEEKFSKRRFLGVILAFMGSMLTSLHDAGGISFHQIHNQLIGDLCGFLAGLSHAGYTIIVRKVTPANEHMSMSLMLGFVGLINMILLGPIAIYMSVYGETNTISMWNVTSGNESNTSTWILFGWLIIKGLFGNLLPDYIWGVQLY